VHRVRPHGTILQLCNSARVIGLARQPDPQSDYGCRAARLRDCPAERGMDLIRLLAPENNLQNARPRGILPVSHHSVRVTKTIATFV